ncbi:probable auxin efflux carrier component 5c [Musa acuminata AAA Group]|uniref:probable auxin efflux carrier component 5c n=1 Tax=Musa acuminata AAA Group TaxID=214697 RepID=UPI0031E19112
MYGRWAQDIVVQLSVVQGIAWMALLLFALEMKKASGAAGFAPVAIVAGAGGQVVALEPQQATDVGCNTDVVARPTLGSLMKTVRLKLALNPNIYARVALRDAINHGEIGVGDVQGWDIHIMTPLYVAFDLGYGSVQWWHIFTSEHCEAINRLIIYFTFKFTNTNF